MSRAAFLLDKLMSRVGLHGKAFLPLISSFACAIPGIMATRTIESRRDRFATIMIAPFMSCSARLPVYTLMIATFFAGRTVFGVISLGAVLMLAMYALGIMVAIIVAFVLKRTVLKAPPPPFLMELPPYRLPNLRTVFQNMLTRAWLFLKRAGTVILAISIILWALMYFPRASAPVPDPGSPVDNVQQIASNAPLPESEQLKHSFAGMLGHAIEPVIRPLGFDWKIGVALIASFAAREVLVSTLSIIYNVGKDEDAQSQTLIAAVRDAKTDDGRPAWTPSDGLDADGLLCSGDAVYVDHGGRSPRNQFMAVAAVYGRLYDRVGVCRCVDHVSGWEGLWDLVRMDIQEIIVIAVILAAVGYGAVVLGRRTRSFSAKDGCGADCGCNGGSKKVTPRI